ncbi:MAG: helix-turn-helix transcriptional regulator [Beijerinckiaceae bacterium]
MPKFDASKLASLIDDIYEAAARPELWCGLLADISDAAGMHGAGLLGCPSLGFMPVCSESLDEALDTGLRTGWLLDRNVALARMLNAFQQGHDIVTGEMIFSPWELDHLPFNTEFMAPFKIGTGAAMRLAGEGRSSLVLGLLADLGSEPISASETEALRALLPHMQRAGQLALQLGVARQEGLLNALATFERGAVLLDWRGRVLRMNAKAEAMMGVGIAVRGGMLTAASRDGDTALQKLIGSVIAPGPLHDVEPIGAVALARPGARPLVVHGAPLARSAQDMFQQARAILTIDDPNARQAPHGPILRQVFGLTAAEADVAIALASGRDIEEVAQIRGVSIGTLRNQVKTVFAKTDTSRQAYGLAA